MPIFVAEYTFSKEQEEKINKKHREWKEYISYTSQLKRLKKGEYFLSISNVPKEEKFIKIAKFLEYDRISNLGYISHIKKGKEIPIKDFEKDLGITFKELTKKKYLNNDDKETLINNYKKYLPK